MHTFNKESAPTCVLLWGSSILDSFWEGFSDYSLYVFSCRHIVFCKTEVKTEHQWVQDKVNLNILRVLQLQATNTSSGSRKQILERRWIQRRVRGPRSERRRTEQLPGSMQQDDLQDAWHKLQLWPLSGFCFVLFHLVQGPNLCETVSNKSRLGHTLTRWLKDSMLRDQTLSPKKPNGVSLLGWGRKSSPKVGSALVPEDGKWSWAEKPQMSTSTSPQTVLAISLNCLFFQLLGTALQRLMLFHVHVTTGPIKNHMLHCRVFKLEEKFRAPRELMSCYPLKAKQLICLFLFGQPGSSELKVSDCFTTSLYNLKPRFSNPTKSTPHHHHHHHLTAVWGFNLAWS